MVECGCGGGDQLVGDGADLRWCLGRGECLEVRRQVRQGGGLVRQRVVGQEGLGFAAGHAI
ncbi:hypothetical protein AQI95_39430 [Streptomyces yokosukanensis]|uniref:Uncharacterized protein n=1 Tax=Streptomyces yokosukanensis TaxID=67386 RepID=A0A117PYU8_9ACTN|nr:hypothetical protein AQI95_39430 [Streptomyces yokosukanensis]